MEEQRKGYWVQTFTGRAVWPLDPRPEEIFIEDVAHHLSMLCRFAGAGQRFLSIAEHCCNVATRTSDENKLEALLHDGPEYVLSDVLSPVKRSLTEYKVLEDLQARAFATRFGLKYPWPAEVHELDLRELIAERDQNMKRSPRPPHDGWPDHLEPLDVEMQYWPPEVAEARFLEAFALYSSRRS